MSNKLLGFVGHWTLDILCSNGQGNGLAKASPLLGIEMSKYKSYTINVSPVEQVEGKFQKELTNWFNKQPYAKAVIEGGDGKEQKRHLHGIVYYDEAREKSSINKAITRIVMKHCPESLGPDGKLKTWYKDGKPCNAVMIRIAYNDDFIEEYMEKDVTETLRDFVPDERDEYYPSEEEQEKVKSKAKAVDQRFHRLSEKFKETNPLWADIPEWKQQATVAYFLASEMFDKHTERVIQDKKVRVQVCQSLTMYIYKIKKRSEFMTQDDYEIYSDRLEYENENQNETT